MSKKAVIEKKIAKIFFNIDQMLLDMGDYYSDTISWLCDMAKIKYDSDKAFVENDYDEKIAKKAYAIILRDNPDKIFSDMIDYYYQNIEELHQFLSWNECSRVKNIPIIKYFHILASYARELYFAGLCSKEDVEKVVAIKKYLDSTNIDLVSYANAFGNTFFQYLDIGYYVRTNSAFTVGHTTYDDDPEYYLGEYVCHASISNAYRQGYTIAFRKEKDSIVASIYEFSSDGKVGAFMHKDMHYSVKVKESNKISLPEKIAKKINEFTRDRSTENDLKVHDISNTDSEE